MITATEITDFIDQHSRNLLIPRDGHAALMQILQAARQKIAESAKETEAGGPG